MGSRYIVRTRGSSGCGVVSKTPALEQNEVEKPSRIDLPQVQFLRAASNDGEQVIFSHDSRNAFVIHLHPSSPQFRCDPPIAVTAPMFQDDLLNRRPHFHVFFLRHLFL
jgi:hypothetical protein